ncbi:MAG: EAL domain-containing protein [Pseudomonadota bacterium]
MKRNFEARFGDFYIDGQGLRDSAGVALALHPKELAVLSLLVQHAGKLVSKEVLINSVWKGVPASDASIARCISVVKSHLRKAHPGSDHWIKTEYGRGYRFVGEVSHPMSYVCEEVLNTVLDVSPDVIVLKDGTGRWLTANQAAVSLLGLEGKNWRGKTDEELAAVLPAGSVDALRSCCAGDEEVWLGAQPAHVAQSVCLPDGSERRFDFIKSPLFNQDGSRNSLIVLGRDVSGFAQEQAVNNLTAQVLDNSREAVVITDADNNIRFVNRAFPEVTGYTLEEVTGKNPRLLASGRHDDEFYQAMWHGILVEGSWRGEIWDRRKNGETYPKWLDVSTVHDRNGKLTNYIAIFTDLTDRKMAEEQIKFLAYHDPLTRLPNRLLLRDRFDQAVAAASRDGALVALLFLDLDQFKQVNDSLGHEIGDQLLLSVSKRLEGFVRDSDTVSRLGGDEFVILLTEVQEAGVVSGVAHKLINLLEEPFIVGDYALHTSFSIGISLYPDDASDFETLMKMADTAMYHAKNCGRNTYRFYTEQMNISAMERMQLQSDLKQALEAQAFELYYQPQYDLKTRKLVGLEALIRWNTGEGGVLPPERFLPAAEENGMIVQIGEWVLREACRQNRAWQDAGYEPVRVSVNLSVPQFRSNGGMVDLTRRVLEETGLAAQWLDLELNETILIQNVEHMLRVVRELKGLGVSLSIDDFGTGYSSLVYLKRFAVDRLKIDQSFVRNLGVDASDAAIVHAVIHLGRCLGLKTVAEGVETAEQLEVLQKEGCDEAQGYYYAHPLPANKVTQFLTPAGKAAKRKAFQSETAED